jgi:NAD(P)-dependent dehydrogenase (short-subunit alcohol dehydrogenase family)|tara:strand:- start:235 stop:1062 length:828 start_codon:yes stop_codon:yes gene_type:complete
MHKEYYPSLFKNIVTDLGSELTKMDDLFSVKNKIVIITGSGRGIGRTFALNMAKRSAITYCFDIKFPNKIPKDLSNNLFHIKCDLTNKKKFDNECKKIFNRHKKIDVLINNLGISLPGKNEQTYLEKYWDQTLKINLTVAFNCSQTVMKFMLKKKNGSIINITSINAELGFPNNPAYIASKGGLKMLGKSMAKDLGKYGIRVNNLGPGYFKTLMNQNSWKNLKTRKARTIRTMLDRWGEIDELVGPCIFLASDASKYVTAQDLYVDGGWTANGLS